MNDTEQDQIRLALVVARTALSETIVRATNGYDWNADPDYITLKQGEAFAAIDAALAATPAREEG